MKPHLHEVTAGRQESIAERTERNAWLTVSAVILLATFVSGGLLVLGR